MGHVLAQHPELAAHLAAVAETLTDPERVMRDARFANRECFYRPIPLPAPLDRLYRKVVVEFPQVSVGEVVTAFLLPKIKRSEVQRWP